VRKWIALVKHTFIKFHTKNCNSFILTIQNLIKKLDITVQLKNCTGTNHCPDNKNIIKTDLRKYCVNSIQGKGRPVDTWITSSKIFIHCSLIGECLLLMSNFCGPNLLTGQLFKQMLSLKLFLNVKIKYAVSQKEQIQIYCLESSSVYRYMPLGLPTLDNDWRCISFHHLTLPWSMSSRCAADAALTSAEFAAAMDLAASKIISSKFRLSSAS